MGELRLDDGNSTPFGAESVSLAGLDDPRHQSWPSCLHKVAQCGNLASTSYVIRWMSAKLDRYWTTQLCHVKTNIESGYHVSAKFGLTWDLVVGGATALGVGTLGWLDVELARTPDAADVSIREFGTLLTVLFGALAGLWWNQSARLPNTHSDEAAPASQSQVDANILNGAAATFTVLSLFCSAFAGSPWRSPGSWLSAIGALVVLMFSGNDIRQAVPITLRLRPLLREKLVLVLIAVGAAALLWHFGA